MNLVIQKKSISEFTDIEKSIIDNDQSFDQQYETWKILDDFFVQDFYEKDFVWRWTYFRIYVQLTWKLIGTVMDNNKFAEIVRRQAPMAILLDVDVFKEILWYLAFNRTNKNQLISLYTKVRNDFLESQTVVGEWRGEGISVRDLVGEYVILRKRNAESIEIAEFIAKLRQVLCPAEALSFIYIDNDTGVDRFLELVNFFQDIDNIQKLEEVMEVFLKPELYEKSASQQVAETNSKPEKEVRAEKNILQNVEDVQEKRGIINKEVRKEVGVQRPAISAVQPEIPSKPSYQEIKSEIEQEFKKDREGNFEDIDAVMRKLEEFTEMYTDPKIADLLYFDEEDNRFKWKV